MADTSPSEKLGLLKKLFHHLNVGDDKSIAKITEALGPDIGSEYASHFLKKWQNKTNSPKDALSLCLDGWSNYYSAKYVEAGRLFSEAWDCQGAWDSWSALGKGKVCSDLGHWYDALRWLMVALDLARTENDFNRMAESYGAMGEVLYRAGAFRQAFELFSTDSRLLPSGSNHHFRLKNYIAFCLGRLGRFELARPILWESYFGTQDHDPSSATFSLASLFVLSVYTKKDELFQRLKQLPPLAIGIGTEMPRAFIQICYAYWDCQNGDRKESEQHLNNALNLLNKHYPVEHFWVTRLKTEIFGGIVPIGSLQLLQQRLHPHFNLDLHSFSILDEHLLTLIPDRSTPFAELETGMGTDDLWKSMRLFFI